MRRVPTKAELETFYRLLACEVGFRFEDDRLSFLADLLSTRLHVTKLKPAAYFRHLAKTPNEVAELARALTITETYFLRNRDHFHAFEALLRAREASGERELRVLSAGSSSGEEAYTLAMLLRETLVDLDGWKLSVLGVDLNPDVIDKARAATYSQWSLRDTPQDTREKHFHKQGARFVLSESIRDMVRFDVQNLLHADDGIWSPGAFDVVFCRNVLMYFTPEATQEVVANISSSLSPGGYLFIGHAENLRGVSQDFHLRHTHNTFYYQHRSGAAAASDTGRKAPRSTASPGFATGSSDKNSSWVSAITGATGRILRLSRNAPDANKTATATAPDAVDPIAPSRARVDKDLAPAMAMLQQERFQEALSLLAADPSAIPNPDELLLRAMLLVLAGELEQAEERCEELLAIDELYAGAHYIMAMCREHSGDRAGAIEHSESAAYLDDNFAMPRLQLGRLARRMGKLESARRELTLALSLLAREDADRIALYGGGFDREVLMNLCRSELSACGDER